MCCDGTLFGQAPLEPGEASVAQYLGLVADEAVVGNSFDLPCPAFADGCCSYYAVTRPHVCGGYKCRPLMAYEAGDATLEECIEIVRLYQGLARSLEDEMGMVPGSFTRQALAGFFEEHEPTADRARYRSLLATLDQFHYLGMRYFGHEAEPADVASVEVVPA
jgi:hypothetical protein